MGLARRRFSIFATGVAVGALMTGSATAQDGDQEGGFTLLQRLILGAGVEKVAVDTPQAVTTVNQEDIDQEVPETVANIVEKIPGVNATGNKDNILGQNFNIRGFGPQEVGSNQEGRVLVNVDGATKYYESYRMGGFFGDTELYKAVEVLRGPASGTLYGTSVLGGVINLTTKDASDFLEEGDTGAVRLKVTGDSNQKGYKASAILALRMSENAEFLANLNYTDFQNIIDGDGNELLGTGNQFPSGLVKGTFYLDDEKERVFRVKYEQTQVEGTTTLTPGGAPVGPRFVDRFAQDTSALISYQDEASDNPWLDLNVNLSFSETRNEQQGAQDFIRADMSYTYYELKADNTFEWIGESYENYLTLGFAGKYHERRREDLDGTSVSSHPEGNERYAGVFAQNEFVYDEMLTIIGGLRVDWRELEPTGSTLFERDTTSPRPVQPTSVSDFAFAPKIAAIYAVTDWLNVFGSYAYTERMPGIDEEFDWNATTVQNNLGKETANSLEAGISGSIDGAVQPDDNFSYKITGFYNLIDDLVVRGGTGQPDFINQGEGRIYGAEMEIAYDSTYLFASAYGSLIRGDNLFTDKPLTSIAPDEVGFTVGGKVPDYDIRFGWDARFVAAQTRVPTGTDTSGLRYQPFNVHDIFATWRPADGPLSGFEAVARIDNLFDENYQEYLQTAGPAKGRTFKVSVAHTFRF